MLTVKNLTKSYGERNVLRDFSYDFPDEGFVCISGKSGIGKTTLLNLIMGLERADSGEIIWKKPDVKISCVFQEDRLLEGESVLENVLFVLKERYEANVDYAERILVELGLGEELNTKAKDLSGGQT